MNIELRLLNWSRWTAERLGPEGFPETLSIYKRANKSTWEGEGWGNESPPEAPEGEIDQRDAEVVDEAINELPMQFRSVLIIEYAHGPIVERPKRRQNTRDFVPTAVKLLEERLK